jgi:peptidoglycan/LPS O-acetylase OafA/YrhL
VSRRKIGAMILGIVTLSFIGFVIYKVIVGKEVGFNEIYPIGVLLMMFFSAITWGSKQEKDGILEEEELGRKITEKSAKISYFILLLVIFVAVCTDQLVNGTTNMFLLGVLGIAMVILPFVEFLVARKYR